jgi:hypothetical protein
MRRSLRRSGNALTILFGLRESNAREGTHDVNARFRFPLLLQILFVDLALFSNVYYAFFAFSISRATLIATQESSLASVVIRSFLHTQPTLSTFQCGSRYSHHLDLDSR